MAKALLSCQFSLTGKESRFEIFQGGHWPAPPLGHPLAMPMLPTYSIHQSMNIHLSLIKPLLANRISGFLCCTSTSIKVSGITFTCRACMKHQMFHSRFLGPMLSQVMEVRYVLSI